MPESALPELLALEKIMELGARHLQVQEPCRITLSSGRSFPVHAITLGNPSLDVPAVGYFGGVHGLERIGAQVVIAFLQNIVTRLSWDRSLHRLLEDVRLTRALKDFRDADKRTRCNMLDSKCPALYAAQRVGSFFISQPLWRCREVTDIQAATRHLVYQAMQRNRIVDVALRVRISPDVEFIPIRGM